jgi:hypothetical protein
MGWLVLALIAMLLGAVSLFLLATGGPAALILFWGAWWLIDRIETALLRQPPRSV